MRSRLETIDAIQSECTLCGLCNEVCPSFKTELLEELAPRGRIALAKHWIEGNVAVDSPELGNFDSCAACNLCEKACPKDLDLTKLFSEVQALRRETHPMAFSQSHRKEETQYWRMRSPFWRQFWKRSLGSQGSYVYQNQRPGDVSVFVPCELDLFHHDLVERAIGQIESTGIKVQIDGKLGCCGRIWERLIHLPFEPSVIKRLKRRQEHLRKKFETWAQPSVIYLVSP